MTVSLPCHLLLLILLENHTHYLAVIWYVWNVYYDSIDAERKRHNLAMEQLQKAQSEWAKKQQEWIDFINKQLRLETAAETKFTELNDTMWYLANGLSPPISRTAIERFLHPQQ